ncbi:MAG: HlyC/CorC family transporter [Coxiellaceae bacterium]|nr:HlyC/CorC family transporter [Coxiellaceae bacterium]
MLHADSSVLIIVLVVLILVSAFFSGSETGIVSLNRYRLRHLAKKKHRAAKRVEKMLSRPDRVLGMILIGNTFANVFAAAIATVLAVRWFGSYGAVIASFGLTAILLIFSETAPKTLAVMYPERVAFPASWTLSFLLKTFYPVVWVVNLLANGFLRLLGIKLNRDGLEPLSMDELRSLVNEATGKISSSYQSMLLRILDLEHETVDDVMVPRSEIYGVDIEQPWGKIEECLVNCVHRYVPLYCENIDQVMGMVSVRKALKLLAKGELDKNMLLHLSEDIYFIPETAPLNKQLVHFQQQQKYIGMVVDEYGDIQGVICLKDIVEEVVGEFEQGIGQMDREIRPQGDGSYILDGGVNLRDVNRIMGWHLPVEGPKTLSGLMVEELEMMPNGKLCMRIVGYPLEVIKLSGKTIQLVRIWPNKRNN